MAPPGNINPQEDMMSLSNGGQRKKPTITRKLAEELSGAIDELPPLVRHQVLALFSSALGEEAPIEITFALEDSVEEIEEHTQFSTAEIARRLCTGNQQQVMLTSITLGGMKPETLQLIVPYILQVFERADHLEGCNCRSRLPVFQTLLERAKADEAEAGDGEDSEQNLAA